MIKNTYKRLLITGTLLAGSAICSNNVLASTTSTTFTVTASVAAACTVAASNLAFGNFTATADVLGTSTITATCTNGAAYNIGLSIGNGSGATTSNRVMTAAVGSTSYLLNYNLYTDSARSVIWAPATSSTVVTGTNGGTGTGAAQTYTVYGKLPLSGNTTAYIGSYTDTIAVTVYF
ncbi:MAG: Csu type fimbrial protein [Janthinobacterium lividum]